MVLSQGKMRCKSCGLLAVNVNPLTRSVRDVAVERLALAPDTLTRAAQLASTDGHEMSGYEALRHDAKQLWPEGDITAQELQHLLHELNAKVENTLVLLAWWDNASVGQQHSMLRLVFDRIDVVPATYRGERFTVDRLRPTFRDWSAAR